MNRNSLTRTKLYASAGILCVALNGQSFAASLAPHRAFYVLEEARADKSRDGISAISGKLAYEVTGSDCEGYAVSYRIGTRFVQGEGETQVSDVQLTSFESGDGLELDQQQKQFVNAQLASESRLKVKKKTPDAAGEGVFSVPEVKAFTTDPNVIFPTKFQQKLLAVAQQGGVRDESLVYEGSDGEKAVRAISFVGAKKDLGKLVNEADSVTIASLNKLPYWPMTVSYYTEGAKGDDAPLYQANFNMLENGVSTDLVLDYGTYALKGRLDKIEMLKADNCK